MADMRSMVKDLIQEQGSLFRETIRALGAQNSANSPGQSSGFGGRTPGSGGFRTPRAVGTTGGSQASPDSRPPRKVPATGGGSASGFTMTNSDLGNALFPDEEDPMEEDPPQGDNQVPGNLFAGLQTGNQGVVPPTNFRPGNPGGGADAAATGQIPAGGAVPQGEGGVAPQPAGGPAAAAAAGQPAGAPVGGQAGGPAAAPGDQAGPGGNPGGGNAQQPLTPVQQGWKDIELLKGTLDAQMKDYARATSANQLDFTDDTLFGDTWGWMTPAQELAPTDQRVEVQPHMIGLFGSWFLSQDYDIAAQFTMRKVLESCRNSRRPTERMQKVAAKFGVLMAGRVVFKSAVVMLSLIIARNGRENARAPWQD